MGYRKENKFAFDEARKESFTARLKQLIGNRSVRAAAKEWGLSFSTLNNYITRGTEPSFVAMQAIASTEGVSLDWLAFGFESNKHHHCKLESMEEPLITKAQTISSENQQSPLIKNSTATPADGDYHWFKVIWDSLEQHERHGLSQLLGRKGADVLTLLLEEHALSLLKLTGDAREAALLLEKLPESELREILHKYRGVTNDQSISVEHKQAG
ncbi:helix-turn-helix domain-containing protein [Trabulsiella odontotermitis]|uniref:helix-turn-helix domain-containing protein n=1 Tax=Trabulsiella odontotermitis TaxID=379893 RepID=UPI00092CEDDD|nr:helix-turn-helix domain-containing protein [Trabulsiella odontotermitis]